MTDFESFCLPAFADMRIRARFNVAPDGGPIRDLCAVPSHKAMGHYPSAKAGRSLSWNEFVQRSRYWQCEADPDVATYMAQPYRVDIMLSDRREAEPFFPDLRVEYRSGRTEIERLIPPRGVSIREQRNIELARDICLGRGFGFRVLYASEVLDTVAEKNAILIAVDRYTIVRANDLFRAIEAFESLGGEAPYARAIEALGGPGEGRAVLHALIMRGYVGIDLQKPILISSRVWWRADTGASG